MKKFVNLINTSLINLVVWYYANRHKIIKGLDELGKTCFKLAKILVTSVFIGILLNVASYFFPELPEKIPTIYAFYNGCIVLGEFSVKLSLRFIYLTLTGNQDSWFNEASLAWGDIWKQFIEWLSHIRF